MSKPLNLAILCGGQTAEHEISVISAQNIVAALDAEKYLIHVIYISKQGEFFLLDAAATLLQNNDLSLLIGGDLCQPITWVFGQDDKSILFLNNVNQTLKFDVVFPVLHGTHGEDGTMQGLLEIANLPYVAPGVLSSAVCMDKVVSKILLRAAGIPVANSFSVDEKKARQLDYATVVAELGTPFFIKPANTGSSVGISKVKSAAEFLPAINLALDYDCKILCEEFIFGREIECSVLGNENPQASLPGEIITRHEFYSYEAKYLDHDGAELVIPAKLTDILMARVRELAKQAFIALNCEGMARVDFFITPDEQVFVNEANTIPGFTQISMYPKLWEATGVSYSELLDRLIQLAIERFNRNRVLIKARSAPQMNQAA